MSIGQWLVKRTRKSHCYLVITRIIGVKFLDQSALVIRQISTIKLNFYSIGSALKLTDTVV